MTHLYRAAGLVAIALALSACDQLSSKSPPDSGALQDRTLGLGLSTQQKVNVPFGGSWRVTDYPDWLKVSQQGGKGAVSFTLTADRQQATPVAADQASLSGVIKVSWTSGEGSAAQNGTASWTVTAQQYELTGRAALPAQVTGTDLVTSAARPAAGTVAPRGVIVKYRSGALETQIKGALDRYTNAQPIGKWMRSIKGIGPVISAGYIANIDIAKANTAGKLWKYCGVAPGADRRVRGQKMAYNPSLKRLAYLTGESFKRLSSDDPEAYYRHWYDRRKLYEIASNEAGKYAEQAAAILSSKKIGKTTDAYKAYSAGKLPPAHIDRRACRWTTKLFLSHLQETWWTMKTGEPPPRPFALSVMGHADYIAPP